MHGQYIRKYLASHVISVVKLSHVTIRAVITREGGVTSPNVEVNSAITTQCIRRIMTLGNIIAKGPRDLRLNIKDQLHALMKRVRKYENKMRDFHNFLSEVATQRRLFFYQFDAAGTPSSTHHSSIFCQHNLIIIS